MSTHSKIRPHGNIECLLAESVQGSIPVQYTKRPLLVQWMATLKCPLSCEHCLASGVQMPDMPLPQVLNLIDQVADLNVDEFLITGGEPLVRDDLDQIIAYLGKRKVNYSINTALFPHVTLKRAFKKNPPRYAAISLDGPKDIHNQFRHSPASFDAAIEAISFFKGLESCTVAAGTTVTTANFPFLPETFPLVVASGVDEWGIHLLIPEGKAAHNKHLFLSKAQLKRLIRFVAKKRISFPVVMADEFGFCGDWEPLLRDSPIFCGAGRTHCVVLPNGDVVPCTTLDTSASSGNISNQTLSSIWKIGFETQRNWAPQEKCRTCEYAFACQGGCWLQRKNKQDCYKDIWQLPSPVSQPLKSTAQVLMCVGLLQAGACSGSNVDNDSESLKGTSEIQLIQHGNHNQKQQNSKNNETLAEQNNAAIRQNNDGPTKQSAVDLDAEILNWSMGVFSTIPAWKTQFPNYEKKMFSQRLLSDPAGVYLKQLTEDTLPKDIIALSQVTREALQTEYAAISFGAVLWRNLMTACIHTPPEQRTNEENKALKQILTLIKGKSELWYAQLLEKKADSFNQKKQFPFGFKTIATKAGTLRAMIQQGDLLGDTHAERYRHILNRRGIQKKEDITDKKLAVDYLMQLQVRQKDATHKEIDFGIFDTISIDSQTGKTLIWQTPEFTKFAKRKQADGQAYQSILQKAQKTAKVTPGTQLTYIDILALTSHQKKNKFDIYDNPPKAILGGETVADMRATLSADVQLSPKQVQKIESEIFKLLWLAEDFWMF